jgi:hypothetical protein
MRPHTEKDVCALKTSSALSSSYYIREEECSDDCDICVLILLYICPHTDIYVFMKTFTTSYSRVLIGQRCTGHQGRYQYHEFAHNLDGTVDVSLSQLLCACGTMDGHNPHICYFLEGCGLEI